jgi:Rrf2 family protein
MIIMPHLSQRTHYGLLALIELAHRWGGAPVPASDIANARGIPVRFLAGILHELRGAGIVRSARGSRGGFQLAQPPDQVTMLEALRLLAARPPASGCSAAGDSGTCGRHDRCAVTEVLLRAEEAASEVYAGVTLADLALRERDLVSQGLPDFMI